MNWLTTSSGAPVSAHDRSPVEDAQLVKLAGHHGGGLAGVVAVDAEQHQQAGADLADGRAVDDDRGPRDAGDDGPHAAPDRPM